MSRRDDHFAAVLTGEGRGAIAVVRAWGRDALERVDGGFDPHGGRRLVDTPVGVPRFGRFGPGRGEEVIIVATGGAPLPSVEIHGHGGAAAVARTCAILASLGFTLRSIAGPPRSSKTSPSRRDAEVALARATTLRTAQILQDQADGAWDRAWDALIAEATTDTASALEAVDRLIGRAEVGSRLVSGWRVVLAGRPNVGKSRLMNAIAGFDRSVVSAREGTTRDVVTSRISVEGWPVDLSDTAGLRVGHDPLESSGIALTRERMAGADLSLILLDRSRPLAAEDREILEQAPAGLVVANKVDLDPAWDEAEVGALPVSAASGEGLAALLARVATRLVPDPPPPGSAVPFTEAQAEALRATRRRLVGD